MLFLVSIIWSRAADISSRAPTNGFRFINLAADAGAGSAAGRQWALLPKGLEHFNDVPFFVGPPQAVTGMEAARAGDFSPTALRGLKVEGQARRIHLLHGLIGRDKDGVPVARVVFHYADGTEESVRLGYGVHARDWTPSRLEKKSALADANSRVAWSEMDDRRGNALRLFQTALENPRPTETITRLDVVSLFSRATPLILAVTAEGLDAPPRVSVPLPARKILRDLRELPDSAYRRELSVRVTDGESGGPLTKARVSLALTDDAQTFFFGETSVDAQGLARLPYPPQDAVGLHLWVHAPGRLPVIITESRTNLAQFSGDYSVALQPGATVGGLVKATSGQPIAGATVAIYRVTNNSARVFTRIDHDLVVTGADGKWNSRSLPTNLNGFSFEAAHPDYRPAVYVTPGFAAAPPVSATTTSSSTTSFRRLDNGSLVPMNPPRTAPSRSPVLPLLTNDTLLAGRAELILQPAFPLTGTLVDANAKPLPNAELIFLRPESPASRKYLRTDSQGRFQMRVPQPGAAALVVVREGFTPVYQPVQVATNLGPVALQLSPPRVFQGRVVDRSQRPIAGVRVRLDEWQGTTDLLRFEALTDADGRFVWTGAPPSQITMYLSKTNYFNSRHSLAGSVNEMTFPLGRAPGISGRVYDAETGKPIPSFSLVPGRKYSPNQTQIQWERSEATRGRDGEYSLRLDSYMFQPEARLLIEAPGYWPQISPAFNNPDAYTNDFALKKGDGLKGVVQLPDGSPAASATVVLVEKGQNGYLDAGGQLRGGNSSGELVRTDAQGRFEFSPRLNPEKIFASHEQGFAEASVANTNQAGRLTLQKWGAIKGLLRIGDRAEVDSTVRLQNRYDRYTEPGGSSATLSFYLKAEPDTEGIFVFEKVPSGEHRLALEYRFRENQNGETPLSHGQAVMIKAGETNELTLGGTGRRVNGRVQITGGEMTDVDWKRDVHKLTLVLPDPATPPANLLVLTPEAQQKAWADYNERQRKFWQTPAGRERERAERSYVLVFDTNGVFHADHVPPGKYLLSLSVTDPEDDNYSRRPMGNLNKEVVVPGEAGAKVNAPLEIGAFELPIRPRLKIGRLVPPLELKPADGKALKLSDYRGQPVLLNFWGLSIGYNSYDFQVLKEFQNSHGQSGRLVIISCNLDADPKNAAQFAQGQGMAWAQTYLGDWNQTPIPGMFGLNGSSGSVLIDAEGKLASGPLRGTALRNLLTSALSTE